MILQAENKLGTGKALAVHSVQWEEFEFPVDSTAKPTCDFDHLRHLAAKLMMEGLWGEE